MVSQAITAGGSLALQVLALRSLGLEGFGRVSLLIGFIVLASALANGWIGDSLTVLDRTEPATRGALSFSLIVFCFGGAVAGGIFAALVGAGSAATSLLFSLVVVVWLVEETARRLLMARLQFWHLAVNDLVYVTTTIALFTLPWLVGSVPDLAHLLRAMLGGSCAAVVLAGIQLPAEEYRGLLPRTPGLRELAAFAGWRSAQATLRPAAMLGTRLLVLTMVSPTALGLLETARLLVAPAQTVVNGAGAFLLPTYADAEKQGRTDDAERRRRTDRAAGGLAGVAFTTGGVALLALAPLARLVTGDPSGVSAVAVASWTIYITTWAMTLPFVAEAVARRRSRDVFIARATDSTIGLVLALVLLALGGAFTLVPAVMAVGGVVGATLLRAWGRPGDAPRGRVLREGGAPPPDGQPDATRFGSVSDGRSRDGLVM